MTPQMAKTAKAITASAIGIFSMGWLMIGAAPSTQADPPRHAPAYGYRAKHDDDHKRDKKDYKRYDRNERRDRNDHDRRSSDRDHDWNRDRNRRDHIGFTNRDGRNHR